MTRPHLLLLAAVFALMAAALVYREWRHPHRSCEERGGTWTTGASGEAECVVDGKARR